MPEYKSHKIVWALKIAKIVLDSELAKAEKRESKGTAIITPVEDGYSPFEVSVDYLKKHEPKEGGYYVVYADGYKSFCPAKAFEDGYSKEVNDPVIKQEPLKEELNIGFIAKMCHEVNKAYCSHLGDDSQVPFEEAPEDMIQSIIHGIQFHLDNPKASAADSHKNWMTKKLADGWKLGDVKDVEEKTHPLLVEYDKMPEEHRAKDAIFVSIVKTFVSNLKKL